MDEGKAAMKALDGRRRELEAQLKTADEPPPLLHPEMARLYRTKVMELAKALQHPETESRIEATEGFAGGFGPSCGNSGSDPALYAASWTPSC